jgi:prepilin-type N-terminal cleavage/methylation domain-containing protein
MKPFYRLGLINKNQRGFTLIEMLISVAIISAIIGGIATTTFQMYTYNAQSNAHMNAIKQVENAFHWISRDATMAQTVLDTDDPATTGVTEFLVLNWTEWNNDIHRVAYVLEGNEFQRRHSVNNGEAKQIALAQYIEPANTTCNWDDVLGKLTVALTATVSHGSQVVTETRILEVVPRPTH